MNPPESLLSVSYGLLIGVLLGLFLLSVLYAILLSYLEKEWNVVSDYTWFAVVVGVAYTLAAVAILDARAAVLALMAFSVSAVPIVLRSFIIDIRNRNELRRHLERAGNGDGAEEMA